MKKAIRNVTYIDNYADAPEGARYILRQMFDDSWRLEHYSKDGENVLDYKEFPNTSWVKEFHKMLKACRHSAGPSTILWVERPTSLMESFDSELDELYKEFIFRPEMCMDDDDE